MKKLTAALTLAALAVTAPAFAASAISTAAIPFALDIDEYACFVTNTGNKEAEVTTEIVKADFGQANQVLATLTQPAAPGQMVGVILDDMTGGPSAFCRVSGLSKKSAAVIYQAIGYDDARLVTITAP